mgnify:CR=1 FL=1
MKIFPLFTRFGVELEYMIVDTETLDIRTIADQLIESEAGGLEQDVNRGPVDWSNELALHVIEMKTAKPVPKLAGLAENFQAEVNYINSWLATKGCRLLPTAMHPWMNPHRESRLWPHGDREIYETFHRIFDCCGHGWTNLQSVHLNLPFADDAEFVRLHAAIRLILPLLPALAASSPFVDGKRAPNLDQRLETYRHNCRRIPSVSGRVIPEAVRGEADYERKILKKIEKDVRPFDGAGVLEAEWTNARGAIARFCRNTIEIRVLDIQECPAADVAVLQLIEGVLRKLVVEGDWEAQSKISTPALEKILLAVVRDADETVIDNRAYLRLLGIEKGDSIKASEIWRSLLGWTGIDKLKSNDPLKTILTKGPLARRLHRAAGARVNRNGLRELYGQLADCLAQGKLFDA